MQAHGHIETETRMFRKEMLLPDPGLGLGPCPCSNGAQPSTPELAEAQSPC